MIMTCITEELVLEKNDIGIETTCLLMIYYGESIFGIRSPFKTHIYAVLNV